MFLKYYRNKTRTLSKLLVALLVAVQGNIIAEGFRGTTPVRTESGYKNISELAVGDLVLSYNFKNKVLEHHKITKVHKTEVTKLYKITCNHTDMFVDEDHRFFLPLAEKVRWVKAKDLRVGDYILNGIGSNFPITHIETIEGKECVYNISIKNNPFFFVTANNILVHNAAAAVVIGLGSIGGFEIGLSLCAGGGLLAFIFGSLTNNKPVELGGKVSLGVGTVGLGGNAFYKKWTNKEAKARAEQNGWVPDGKDDRDNPAFKDPRSGKRYAPDETQHGAKRWKWIDKKNKRLGSCDADGNVIGR